MSPIHKITKTANRIYIMNNYFSNNFLKTLLAAIYDITCIFPNIQTISILSSFRYKPDLISKNVSWYYRPSIIDAYSDSTLICLKKHIN